MAQQMTQYEIEVAIGDDFWFEYVDAASPAAAVAQVTAALRVPARRFAVVQATGRKA